MTFKQLWPLASARIGPAANLIYRTLTEPCKFGPWKQRFVGGYASLPAAPPPAFPGESYFAEGQVFWLENDPADRSGATLRRFQATRQ